jgi:hypothetical protein
MPIDQAVTDKPINAFSSSGLTAAFREIVQDAYTSGVNPHDGSMNYGDFIEALNSVSERTIARFIAFNELIDVLQSLNHKGSNNGYPLMSPRGATFIVEPLGSSYVGRLYNNDGATLQATISDLKLISETGDA